MGEANELVVELGTTQRCYGYQLTFIASWNTGAPG